MSLCFFHKRDLLTTKNQGGTPCIRYAKGVLQGKFPGGTVFAGMVEAIVQRQDKEERGVGNQNSKYGPAYDEFMHIVQIQSPAAYKFLSTEFPVQTPRNIQYVLNIRDTLLATHFSLESRRRSYYDSRPLSMIKRLTS